jgi:hypothetical protein
LRLSIKPFLSVRCIHSIINLSFSQVILG